MNRIATLTVFAATLATLNACGTESRATTHAAMEPNSVTYAFDGNYEVSLTSEDPNCVADDANWSVAASTNANDVNVYSVDTDPGVPYVQSTRAMKVQNNLQGRSTTRYSLNGCDYGVVTTYSLTLDADGNLAGTVTRQSSGSACDVRESICNFAVSSQRIK